MCHAVAACERHRRDIPTNETVLDRQQVWMTLLIDNTNVMQLDVQILIDRVQSATNRNVILEFDDDLLVGESLEERVEQLVGRGEAGQLLLPPLPPLQQQLQQLARRGTYHCVCVWVVFGRR
jgi:hypothetical protein